MVPLYYEAHVTIDPVVDPRLAFFRGLCSKHGFRVAELLMRKGGGLVPAVDDSFCTGRGTDLEPLVARTAALVADAQRNGYRVRRYKIESALIDVLL
jgi:hypothetical protein